MKAFKALFRIFWERSGAVHASKFRDDFALAKQLREIQRLPERQIFVAHQDH